MKSSKENILEAVCLHFNFSQNLVISLNRRADLVKARQFYFYLCRELTRETLPSMSNYIGRNHATAIHAIRQLEGLMSVYPDVKRDIKAVKRLLVDINPLIVSHIDLLQLTINHTKSFV